MTLKNLGAATRGALVTEGQDLKEVTSNDLDDLISDSLHATNVFDVAAGGTLNLDTPQANLDLYLGSGLIRLTGAPAAAFTLVLPDGDKRTAFKNESGKTCTLDTLTGATPTQSLLDALTKCYHVRGIEIELVADVSAATGALLADGTVNPTGDFDWAGFLLQRPELRDYAESSDAPAAAATIDLDYELGPGFEVTMDQGTTFTFGSPPASGKMGSFTVLVKQDGVGGHAVTWPASVDWHESTVPVLTTGANDVAIFSFMTVDGGARWYGFTGGLDFG